MKNQIYCWCSYTLLADERLSITDAVIFGILYDRCLDGTLRCRIKIEDIMQLTRLSRRTIFYSLQRLVKCGYLTIQQGQLASTYILSADVLPAKKKHKQHAQSTAPEDVLLESGNSERKLSPESHKKKHGRYQHVELTEKKYRELIQEFGEALVEAYISRVDTYCEQHGKVYQSYAAVIRDWIEKDKSATSASESKKGLSSETYLDLVAKLPQETQKLYAETIERHKEKLSELATGIFADDAESFLGYLSLVNRFED